MGCLHLWNPPDWSTIPTVSHCGRPWSISPHLCHQSSPPSPGRLSSIRQPCDINNFVALEVDVCVCVSGKLHVFIYLVCKYLYTHIHTVNIIIYIYMYVCMYVCSMCVFMYYIRILYVYYLCMLVDIRK